MTGKITRLIQKNELGEKPMLDKLLEYWEWQERQCKYVVNCVRIYDFLGFDWKLPLWDDAYLFYWVNIPARFKQGQYLFKKYLTRYNYKSLFKGFRDTFTYGGYSVKGWPGISKSVLPVGWLIGNIFGDSAKNNFYNYCKYFGHYRYAYGAFPYSHYLKYAKQARNPISYFVLSWLEENIT